MSRSTISTFELFEMFPDQESARDQSPRTILDAACALLEWELE